MQNAANEIEQKIGEAASGNEIIRKEVKLLRNMLLGNIFILFFLMFAFFMYTGKSSGSSDDGDIAARESVISSEMPMTENTAPNSHNRQCGHRLFANPGAEWLWR